MKLNEDEEKRKAYILDIFARGKIAVFRSGDLVKKAKEWKEDNHPEFKEFGYLHCFESNGISYSVAWWDFDYEIEEEEGDRSLA